MFRIVVSLIAAGALSACGGAAPPEEEAPLGTDVSDLTSTCAVIPSVGTPFTDSVAIGVGDSCLSGTSNTSGYFTTSSSSPTETYWTMYRPNKTMVETISASGFADVMLPMFDGFSVVVPMDEPPTAEFMVPFPDVGGISAITVIQSEGVNQHWHHSIDYGGGSLVAFGHVNIAGNHWFNIYARRFDANGFPRNAGVQVDTMQHEPAFVAGGVNLSGRSLVIWDGVEMGMGANHIAARWMDRYGVFYGPTFDAGFAPGASDPGVKVDTVPLFDNSVAIRVNGVWALKVRDRLQYGNAVPSWMTAYANGRGVRLLSSNRGYATYPLGGEALASCTQTVKILAQDGHLCGSVNFKAQSGACTGGPMHVGRDGTVIQALPVSCVGPDCVCSHHVWAHFFH